MKRSWVDNLERSLIVAAICANIAFLFRVEHRLTQVETLLATHMHVDKPIVQR